MFMLEISQDFAFVLNSYWTNFVSCLLCLCRSLCDIKQHRGTRYFRVCLHKDAGNYICFDKYFMPFLTGKDFSPLKIWWNCIKWNINHCDWSNIVCIKQKWLLCLTFPPTVVWEAGFPRWHASSFVQPALGSGERRTHQPPGCCWLRPSSLHAHPGTAPTTPFSDSAPPPAAGWTGSVHVFVDMFVSICWCIALSHLWFCSVGPHQEKKFLVTF